MADNNEVKAPKLSKMEGIKESSRQLRGSIAEELANEDPNFAADAAQLLKFHGTYQQDNRELRNRKDEQGNRLGKAYSCMIRICTPGGKLTAAQFLGQIALCDSLGEGTMRLTTRQASQLHGVLKKDLRETINKINKLQLDSYAACGDVNRNVMCNPVPYSNNPILDQMQATTDALAAHLKPKSTSYYDLWITDEQGNKENIAEFEPVEEPIYGKTYLPRKFKIGVALPEDNHADVMTQDTGLIGIVEDGAIVGYNMYVGGGMGRTPSAAKTFPAIGKLMAFVPNDEICAVTEAVVKVQRDFGNRADRKTARLKYLIANWGIDKFRAKVEEYYGSSLAPARDVDITGVDDYMGWHEQGDGKLFLGINIENGRIKDEGDLRIKTGLKKIIEKFQFPVRLTALQSMILCDVDPADKEEVIAILKDHGIKSAEEYSLSRRFSLACPALPMCGLSVTESERVMPSFMDQFDAELEKQGLSDEVISVHMTGCPNGCARPYTPDIGLVGRSVGKYTVFLGGNARGTRLAFIFKDQVPFDEIVPLISPVLSLYKQDREKSETFGDFCARIGEEELIKQFAEVVSS